MKSPLLAIITMLPSSVPVMFAARHSSLRQGKRATDHLYGIGPHDAARYAGCEGSPIFPYVAPCRSWWRLAGRLSCTVLRYGFRCSCYCTAAASCGVGSGIGAGGSFSSE